MQCNANCTERRACWGLCLTRPAKEIKSSLLLHIRRRRIGGAKKTSATVAQRLSAGMHVPCFAAHSSQNYIPTIIYFHARVDIPEMHELLVHAAKSMQFSFKPSFNVSAKIGAIEKTRLLLRHTQEAESLIGSGPSPASEKCHYPQLVRLCGARHPPLLAGASRWPCFFFFFFVSIFCLLRTRRMHGVAAGTAETSSRCRDCFSFLSSTHCPLS